MALKKNYIVIEEIGAGAMATVDKALQKSLNRFVVIKRIHPHLTEKREYVLRFEREAMAMASLRHVNIMDVIDFFEENNQHFLVAEYINGPSLMEVMKRVRQIPLNVSLSVAIQILKGLEHAHNNGVIHRDIKPGNIMFTRNGVLKITDFGVAQAAGLPELPSFERAIVGTRSFMSPEQARGKKIDQRSDLFSAGIILYAMLTAAHPFQGDNDKAILSNLLKKSHEPVSKVNFEIPEKFSRIVDKALQKDATRRFFDAAEFSHALEKYASDEDLPVGSDVIMAFFERILELKSGAEEGDQTPTQIRRDHQTTTVFDKPRPTAAILPLTGCFGCHVNLLDLHEDFIKLHRMIDVQFSYLMDIKKIPKVDIGIVEGCVANSENEERLLELREACDILVPLGTCACFGGVPGLRNLHSAEEVTRRAYLESESTVDGIVPNSPIAPTLLDHVRPVSDVVAVEASIPGCPSPPKLILESLECLLNGFEPESQSEQSLCIECGRKRKNILGSGPDFVADDVRSIMELEKIDPDLCFLEQGVLCMGISTRSGCEGRCVKNNIPCQGCMGPAPHIKETGAKWANTLGSLLPGGSIRFRHDLVGIGYCYTLPISMMPHRNEKR
ncbi:MAG: protein kinase [Desulfobacterales bacterium]|nr:protein kinase [Desulfobacterales bacterium]